MSKQQIALFTFTLRSGGSIGPAALREIWKRASGTDDVSVGRKVLHGNEGKPVYTLYASQGLADLRAVEMRLRGLLEAAHLNASLNVLHA
ncbi:hypothetical protein [Pseudoxanthomonas broegbernensis]|uniref:hypothetical protein n=1 Tax=Pseudoxanthomonas broegbernensis TaxID=83619 RepID=UPI00139187E6|nr:hypothetical protein [Pseudoxanthomonas broegbernensis]MBB6064107.1 hypothetical protein [Pseudoxanthomonas broegbernensis]